MFGLQNYFPKETFKKNFLRSVSVRAEYAENSKITAAREQFKNLYADVMPRVECGSLGARTDPDNVLRAEGC